MEQARIKPQAAENWRFADDISCQNWLGTALTLRMPSQNWHCLGSTEARTTNRKEIRPDENSRHDGRLSSKSQKCVPPRGYAVLEGTTKPVRTPENPRLSPLRRVARGSLVGQGSCCPRCKFTKVAIAALQLLPAYAAGCEDKVRLM